MPSSLRLIEWCFARSIPCVDIGTASNEKLHQILVAAKRRHVQRRIAIIVLCTDIRSICQQHRNDIRQVLRSCVLEWSPTRSSRRVDGSAIGDEESDNIVIGRPEAVGQNRTIQRGPAFPILSIDVSAGGHKQPGDVVLPSHQCGMQTGAAARCIRVNNGTTGNEFLTYFLVASLGRNQQWRLPVISLCIGIGACRKDQMNNLRVATLRGVVEGTGATTVA